MMKYTIISKSQYLTEDMDTSGKNNYKVEQLQKWEMTI